MPFIEYFPQLFTWWIIIALIAGTGGGLILGATEGVSPAMLLALIVPLTLGMDVATGLILLGAVYTGAMAGSARYGTRNPARGGRGAGPPVHRWITASAGGFAGVILLIFLTPVLGKLTATFRPSELFWVALLAIITAASLGTRSFVRSLFAGGCGAWLSTVGYDPLSRVAHPADGIPAIVALIGLLVIPRALELMRLSRDPDRTANSRVYEHDVPPPDRPRMRALALGTILGCILGMLPGAAARIVHVDSRERRRCPPRYPASVTALADPTVLASAESARVGASLVPLLTLSVPGSIAAAVLFTGLLLHGLFPGPDLFTVHAATTGVFVDSLLAAQVLVMILGPSTGRLDRFTARVPGQYVGAVLMVLAVLGAYGVGSRFTDVLVMLALGAGMYVSDKLGFAAAPVVVLGFVLGPFAQSNLLQGRMIAHSMGGALAYFFGGLVNPVLIGLCVLLAGYGVLADVRSARDRKARVST